MTNEFKITRDGSYSFNDNLKYKMQLLIERKAIPAWDRLNEVIATGELHPS